MLKPMRWWAHIPGILFVAVFISACGQIVPLTATEPQGSTPVAAHITLSPDNGETNTPVTIDGAGFAPQAQMQLGFTSTGQSHDPFIIGEVSASSLGVFRLIFVIPLAWKDGSSISEDTLSFWAQTSDRTVLATASYKVTRSLSDARTTLSNSSATVSATQPLPTTIASPTSGVTGLPNTSSTPTATGRITGTPGTTDTPALTVTNPATRIVATISLSQETIKVSIAFLNSLLRDPSGASSLVYLSQRLRNEIATNWGLPTGLGIQPGYNSFEVALLSHSNDTYVIQAIMSYESGASVRDFTLIKENNAWLIDKIVIGIR